MNIHTLSSASETTTTTTWTRSGFLGGRAKVGRFAQLPAVKKRQERGAVAGSWRLWSWRLWWSGAGRAATFLEQFLRLWASLRPCSDKFYLCFDLKVPQIQFIDRVLACCCATETGTHSANCAADRRNSPGAVLGAGSWHARCCIDRCVASRPFDHAATNSSSFQQGNSGGASIQFTDKWALRCGQRQVHSGKLWRFHRCSSSTR